VPETKIRGHKATGTVPWPLILLEGEAGSGRSWRAALLSADPRIGEMYWLDLAEGAGEQYGAIPGADYTVLDHDGTYADILQHVEEVHAEAKRAREAAEPPVALVIDTVSDLWAGLTEWAHTTARKSRKNQEILRADPNADIDPGHTYWNKATARWRRVMLRLMTFPGVVVVIANGGEVTAFDAAGKPTRSKTWSVDGQKRLPSDAMVHVRVFRDDRPQIIKARTVHGGIRPGRDAPRRVEDRDDLLAWIVFDVLRCDPATSTARNIQPVTGGDLTADERADIVADEGEASGSATDPTWLADMQQDIGTCQTEHALLAFWPQIVTAVKEGRCTPADGEALRDRVKMRRGQLTAAKGSAA
jgi:hypothetical protein